MKKKSEIFSISTIVLLIAVILIQQFVLGTVRIKGTSMYPTFEDGEIHVLYRLKKEFKRGEIVAISVPESKKELLAKRIVAMGGDTVLIKEGLLYLNGELVEEHYINHGRSLDLWDYSESESVEVEIPEGHVYVLGDNRGDSLDSRGFGPIPLKNIKGKISDSHIF